MVIDSTPDIKQFLAVLGLDQYLVTDPDGKYALITEPHTYTSHIRISFSAKVRTQGSFEDVLIEFAKSIMGSPAVESIREDHRFEVAKLKEEIFSLNDRLLELEVQP